jgi:nicotinamidase-related amidase
VPEAVADAESEISCKEAPGREHGGTTRSILRWFPNALHWSMWTCRTALHKKLVVDARDILLDKPRHGAFQSTDLELILRSRGIDTVIITGIATSVCCETTAREAVARDFHVFFLSDGTATADMPGASGAELQKATLTTLGFLFAQVLTVDEMMQKIKQAVRIAAV